MIEGQRLAVAVTEHREGRDGFVDEHPRLVQVAGEAGEVGQVAQHVSLRLLGIYVRSGQDRLLEIQPRARRTGAFDGEAEHEGSEERSLRLPHLGECRAHVLECHARCRQLPSAEQHHRLQVCDGGLNLLDAVIGEGVLGLQTALPGLGPAAAHVGEHAVRVQRKCQTGVVTLGAVRSDRLGADLGKSLAGSTA
jgi:hypothetical protein